MPGRFRADPAARLTTILRRIQTSLLKSQVKMPVKRLVKLVMVIT